MKPGEHIHTHNCGVHEFARDYHFAEAAKARSDPAGRRAPHVPGLQAQERQGRHAQLHRHPHQRELLGLRGALHRRRLQPLRHPRRLPQHRRRRALRAGHRLRHGGQGLGRLRRSPAHRMGLRQPPQPRRRADGRPRLRGDADSRSRSPLRAEGERDVPHHDHPGDGRNAQDRRARRRDDQGNACRRQRGEARDGAGFGNHAGAAMRRLGRLLRHHRQPGAGLRRRPAGANRAARRC